MKVVRVFVLGIGLLATRSTIGQINYPTLPNPMVVVGTVLAVPNMTIFNTAVAAQTGADFLTTMATSPLAAVRADNEQRVSKAFAQFRTKFPDDYKQIMQQNNIKLADDNW